MAREIKSTQTQDELYYERCCGIDVHKKMIVACFRNGRKQTVKEFGTQSKELRELAAWLLEGQCEMAAMESTGSYWKPVYNILELLGVEIIVVNAQHLKTVPGRKTDVGDAEWIAKQLSAGNLKASYVPDREQRELREVTRYRKSLTEERAREINRLGKMLEGANIKLTSVVSDVLGKNARRLLMKYSEGVDITQETIGSYLDSCMVGKAGALAEAMDGMMSGTQRKLVKAVLNHIDDMTRRIADLSKIIEDEMSRYDDAIKRMDKMDGIGEQSAQVILAEIGLDMNRFPTAGHLAKWSGLCPGNNESAGKRKSGRASQGNATLKATMVQCAQAAVLKKGTFLRAQYDRLVVRRGKNRAKVAVAHSMIVAIWHMLKYDTEYKDLGGDYYNRFNKEKKISMHLKKLAELGWSPPVQATA